MKTEVDELRLEQVSYALGAILEYRYPYILCGSPDQRRRNLVPILEMIANRYIMQPEWAAAPWTLSCLHRRASIAAL